MGLEGDSFVSKLVWGAKHRWRGGTPGANEADEHLPLEAPGQPLPTEAMAGLAAGYL